MSDIRAYVQQDSVSGASENTFVALKGSKRGDLVVIDWFTEMALEGRCYQVRNGTITTPIVGDTPLADSSAEQCADAIAGLTIIPTYLNISIRLGTGTLHEYAAKSVGAVSTAGTAVFVPLPLLIGGNPALTSARTGTAGSVSVAAEAVTTTRRHWSYSNPVAAAAGHDRTTHEWKPINPPTLVGPACFYVQIAATGTGPSYYSSFDYIELPTVAVS